MEVRVNEEKSKIGGGLYGKCMKDCKKGCGKGRCRSR
jgi:hypothetical protein